MTYLQPQLSIVASGNSSLPVNSVLTPSNFKSQRLYHYSDNINSSHSLFYPNNLLETVSVKTANDTVLSGFRMGSPNDTYNSAYRDSESVLPYTILTRNDSGLNRNRYINSNNQSNKSCERPLERNVIISYRPTNYQEIARIGMLDSLSSTASNSTPHIVYAHNANQARSVRNANDTSLRITGNYERVSTSARKAAQPQTTQPQAKVEGASRSSSEYLGILLDTFQCFYRTGDVQLLKSFGYKNRRLMQLLLYEIIEIKSKQHSHKQDQVDRPSNIADHSSVDSAMRLPRFSDSPLPRYSHLFPGGSEVFAERIRKEENERVALEKELGQEIGILYGRDLYGSRVREKSRVEQMDTALVALDREIAKINLQNKEQIGQLNYLPFYGYWVQMRQYAEGARLWSLKLKEELIKRKYKLKLLRTDPSFAKK